MNIDLDDTPATVALKRRIVELEQENYVLKEKIGVYPVETSMFSDVSDLVPIPMSSDDIPMRRVASWQMKKNVMGDVHAIGKCGPTKDGILSYSYHVSGQEIMQTNFLLNVWGELHKRTILALAQHYKVAAR